MKFCTDTQQDIARLLALQGKAAEELRLAAQQKKLHNMGDSVYLRGLIEFSNICRKNCLYCGIRRDNTALHRYSLQAEEALQAAEWAYKQGFGSIVLQSGEIQDASFVQLIEDLVREIMRMSKGELGITLSLGEQTKETYARWKEAGAIRYLLRIETSSPELYSKLHPADHRFEERLQCLHYLRETGYYVGSGIMMGLPFQSMEQVAADLLFLKDFGVDMVGMGPYIEHGQTPLWALRHNIPIREERYELCLNALAVLRLMMPEINMAATTAMGSLHRQGREEALRIAANVIMPNITPAVHRKDYALYADKICINDSAQDSLENIRQCIENAGCTLALFQQGNPQVIHP